MGRDGMGWDAIGWLRRDSKSGMGWNGWVGPLGVDG